MRTSLRVVLRCKLSISSAKDLPKDWLIGLLLLLLLRVGGADGNDGVEEA